MATWSRLGAVLGPLGASWKPYWAILSHLGGHLGLSEASLAQSWAILDALTTLGAVHPGPGEVVGGGVNPSPKGKKGVGQGISLNHSRPKGLVGLRCGVNGGSVATWVRLGTVWVTLAGMLETLLRTVLGNLERSAASIPKQRRGRQ